MPVFLAYVPHLGQHVWYFAPLRDKWLWRLQWPVRTPTIDPICYLDLSISYRVWVGCRPAMVSLACLHSCALLPCLSMAHAATALVVAHIGSGGHPNRTLRPAEKAGLISPVTGDHCRLNFLKHRDRLNYGCLRFIKCSHDIEESYQGSLLITGRLFYGMH